MSADPSFLPVVVEAAIAGFSVLGGVMAAVSGLFAARAYVLRWTPDALADAVNRGIAIGFILGVMPAVWAFMIVMTIR